MSGTLSNGEAKSHSARRYTEVEVRQERGVGVHKNPKRGTRTDGARCPEGVRKNRWTPSKVIPRALAGKSAGVLDHSECKAMDSGVAMPLYSEAKVRVTSSGIEVSGVGGRGGR